VCLKGVECKRKQPIGNVVMNVRTEGHISEPAWKKRSSTKVKRKKSKQSLQLKG